MGIKIQSASGLTQYRTVRYRLSTSTVTALKGLSHKMDLALMTCMVTLGLNRGYRHFLNFLDVSMLLYCKSVFFTVNASLRWLNNGWLLISSFMLITSGV